MITPDQLAATGTEHGHQTALMQWVATIGIAMDERLRLLFAIPNGGDRRMSVAAAMKAEGVKPGVPDLMLPVPVVERGYVRTGMMRPGLWIEMKKPSLALRKNGGLSEAQVGWHRELTRQGYAVAVCFGWEAAAGTLLRYLVGQLEQESERGIWVKVQNGQCIPF